MYNVRIARQHGRSEASQAGRLSPALVRHATASARAATAPISCRSVGTDERQTATAPAVVRSTDKVYRSSTIHSPCPITFQTTPYLFTAAQYREIAAAVREITQRTTHTTFYTLRENAEYV